MTRLLWDNPAERPYELGVDRGVLYPTSVLGVAWNGLVAVTDAPEDIGVSERYYDGLKYRQSGRPGAFAATLEAFSYPREFEDLDGTSGLVTQQRRKPFGLSYRTMVGASGYKIHLVYNALASPSDVSHESIDDSASLGTFSWALTTTPMRLASGQVTAHLVVDSTIAYSASLAILEDWLYGTASAAPRLPTPAEILNLFDSHVTLLITDNGDGTWSAQGPDDVVFMTDATTFSIVSTTAVYIDTVTYQVSSY